MAKTSRIRRYLKSRSAKSAKAKIGPKKGFRVVTRVMKPRGGVTTFIVSKSDAKIGRRMGSGRVIEKSVYGSDGRLRTIYTIDLGSSTLESELGYAFERNVEKARRENKKKTGRTEAFVGRR